MKNPYTYLEDACQLIDEVANRTSNKTKDDFLSDDNLQDAVTLRIMYIGEALGRVPLDFQTAHPSMPWPQAIGMRNRIAHDYDRVDVNDVWATATNDLPALKALIQEILSAGSEAA